jgi:hypothetical protein|tara:strand:- start:562 stop:768 length:207 start_codon:yes stop_codon:yes gene_type:complete
MSKLTEQYDDFVRSMWVENCVEREGYNEKTLSHNEYKLNYQAYLEDNFYSTVGDNMVWSEEKVDYVTP